MKIYIYEYNGFYAAGVMFIANRELLPSDARKLRLGFDEFTFLCSANTDTLSDDFGNKLVDNETYFVAENG